ncbi:NADPH:quinone oxidoreductase [Senna tora]|uniref:NADPH:quinone oxidoreductase n=1 Tax=Senna tora TaxID=362788 RepID=A0A834X128_9FABA|nr:NADPH:quinone oxidoreductase [Senna tora]
MAVKDEDSEKRVETPEARGGHGKILEGSIVSSSSSVSESESPQGQEKLLELVLGIFINQIAMRVELGRRLKCRDEELWFVDEMEIKKHPYLTKMILYSCSRCVSSSANNGCGFSSEHIGSLIRQELGIRSKTAREKSSSTRERVIVLGRGEENAIGGENLAAKSIDLGRISALIFEIGIDHRQSRNVDALDFHTFNAVFANLDRYRTTSIIHPNTN